MEISSFSGENDAMMENWYQIVYPRADLICYILVKKKGLREFQFTVLNPVGSV